MSSPLPSREGVAIDLALAEVDLSDAPLRDILTIAAVWASGRLVDREAMTPMYRQGGLSGAWYPEYDGDEPDGWLIADE